MFILLLNVLTKRSQVLFLAEDVNNSHYVLVQDENTEDQDSLNYQPCNPLLTVPDYDEIVIFNPDQILPRYLVYYTRITETPEEPLQSNPIKGHSTPTKTSLDSLKIHLLWVDPNDNSDLILVLQANHISVTTFNTSTELFAYLKILAQDGEFLKTMHIKFASNRYRKDDGDEVAGIRLMQSLKFKGSRWENVPFILFCGNAQSVLKEFPRHYDNVHLTESHQEFVELASLPPNAKVPAKDKEKSKTMQKITMFANKLSTSKQKKLNASKLSHSDSPSSSLQSNNTPSITALSPRPTHVPPLTPKPPPPNPTPPRPTPTLTPTSTPKPTSIPTPQPQILPPIPTDLRTFEPTLKSAIIILNYKQNFELRGLEQWLNSEGFVISKLYGKSAKEITAFQQVGIGHITVFVNENRNLKKLVEITLKTEKSN